MNDDTGYLCWAPKLGQTLRNAIVCGQDTLDTARDAAEAFAAQLLVPGDPLTELTVYVARSFSGTHESFHVRGDGARWLAYPARL